MPHHVDRNEPGLAASPAGYSLAAARRLFQLFIVLAAASTSAADAPAAASGPQLRFEPASFDFGTVDTGASSPIPTLFLFNDSNSVAATGLHFENGANFP